MPAPGWGFRDLKHFLSQNMLKCLAARPGQTAGGKRQPAVLPPSPRNTAGQPRKQSHLPDQQLVRNHAQAQPSLAQLLTYRSMSQVVALVRRHRVLRWFITQPRITEVPWSKSSLPILQCLSWLSYPWFKGHLGPPLPPRDEQCPGV